MVHVTRAIESAIELLIRTPGSTLGHQLERLRLGTSHSTGRVDAAECAAVRTVDRCYLGVLRGLTDGEQMAIYLRYYWRPGYDSVERRVRGQGGKSVVVESRRPRRPTLDQCAKAMELTLDQYRRLLTAARKRCEANMSSTATPMGWTCCNT